MTQQLFDDYVPVMVCQASVTIKVDRGKKPKPGRQRGHPVEWIPDTYTRRFQCQCGEGHKADGSHVMAFHSAGIATILGVQLRIEWLDGQKELDVTHLVAKDNR